MNGHQTWSLAVDFGTTATAAAVRDGDGTVRGLAMTAGGQTGLAVPSAVFAEDDGSLVAGTIAENLANQNPSAFEATPKRRIAEGTVYLGGHQYTIVELIGAVLAPVLEEAYRQHNHVPPASVTLTHPVQWKKSRRDLLTQAYHRGAQLASVPEPPTPKLVSEPEAAAHWYFRNELPPAGQYFAVYDLGGGTFDTTVLRSTGTGFKAEEPSGGKEQIGGCDFDEALFNHVGHRYIEPTDSQLWQQLRSATSGEISTQRHNLRARVRMAKEQLTAQRSVTLSRVPGYPEPVRISRLEVYEPLIRRLVDETITELTDTLAEIGLSTADLTAIYRIGGAARTPLVGEALARLGCPILNIDEPKLVVAQGGALLTATRTPPPPVFVHPIVNDNDDSRGDVRVIPPDPPDREQDPPVREEQILRVQQQEVTPPKRRGVFTSIWLPALLILLAGLIAQQLTMGQHFHNGASTPSGFGNTMLGWAFIGAIGYLVRGYRRRRRESGQSPVRQPPSS